MSFSELNRTFPCNLISKISPLIYIVVVVLGSLKSELESMFYESKFCEYETYSLDSSSVDKNIIVNINDQKIFYFNAFFNSII